MDRYPVFYQGDGKLRQQDLMRNIWCPLYRICLDEAARSNSLMDCRQCGNYAVDFKDSWDDRHLFSESR